MKKVFRIFTMLVFATAGIYLGFFLVTQMSSLVTGYSDTAKLILTVGVVSFPTLVFAVFGYVMAPRINENAESLADRIVKRLQKAPIQELVGGAAGLIIGLIIAYFIGRAFSGLPWLGDVLPVLLSLFLGYIGMIVGAKKKEDFSKIFSFRTGRSKGTEHSYAKAKVVDTSVIIDGRIADLCKTGFIEGKLVIPDFVLEELQHIADSSDSLKRNRGRRGLDILNKVRKDSLIPVEIYESDPDENMEVDSRLVKLAQKIDGAVLTNDFNLNKVAELQGIRVLNINELTNAVKTVVLPGEEMDAYIVKDGKEEDQGVAYLDDGTMIVVQGGKRLIGRTHPVEVTSVIQTAAGRMIFARPKA